MIRHHAFKLTLALMLASLAFSIEATTTNAATVARLSDTLNAVVIPCPTGLNSDDLPEFSTACMVVEQAVMDLSFYRSIIGSRLTLDGYEIVAAWRLDNGSNAAGYYNARLNLFITIAIRQEDGALITVMQFLR